MFSIEILKMLHDFVLREMARSSVNFYEMTLSHLTKVLKPPVVSIRRDTKIPNTTVTKTCRKTLVTYL